MKSSTTKSTQFDLLYPTNSGFTKTAIHFFSGKPDLCSLFYAKQKNGSADCEKTARLFVTDTTIAELPSVKKFISLFTKDKDSDVSLPAFTATCGNDVLLVLGAGESYKTMNSVLSIEQVALNRNFDRNCTFVAIGGGVICDMTGFAASIFKRGVAVEFVPTTLLAMVDASLGGKTGCDFQGYKNMIGSFYPASSLYIWSSFVQSLPENEYRSGLAEAVKTALLFSPDLYKLFEKEHDKVMKRNASVLEEMISVCVQAKASVVHEDFREKGKRALLNYGHTFGHAFESVAGLGVVTHGDAVAWGMGRALDLSASLELCTKQYASSVKKVLASYGWDMNAIPKTLSANSTGKTTTSITKQLLNAMHKDKKNSSTTKIKVILQSALCENEIKEVSEAKILPVIS